MEHGSRAVAATAKAPPATSSTALHRTHEGQQRVLDARGRGDSARARCPPQPAVPDGVQRRQAGHPAVVDRHRRPADHLCATATHSGHGWRMRYEKQQVCMMARGLTTGCGEMARAHDDCSRAQRARRAHVMHCRAAAATRGASARPARSPQLWSSDPEVRPSSARQIHRGGRLRHVVARASAPGGCGAAGRRRRARARPATWLSCHTGYNFVL